MHKNVQNHICGKAQFLMPADYKSMVHGIYPVTSVIVFSLLFSLFESPCCREPHSQLASPHSWKSILCSMFNNFLFSIEATTFWNQQLVENILSSLCEELMVLWVCFSVLNLKLDVSLTRLLFQSPQTPSAAFGSPSAQLLFCQQYFCSARVMVNS